MVNLLQETLESTSCGRSFPRRLRLLLVHCRSIRMICRSMCAKARGTHSVRSGATASSAPPPSRLRHDAKDGVVAADAGSDLLVVFLGVTHLVELGLTDRQDGGQGQQNARERAWRAWLLTVDANMEPPNQTA